MGGGCEKHLRGVGGIPERVKKTKWGVAKKIEGGGGGGGVGGYAGEDKDKMRGVVAKKN